MHSKIIYSLLLLALSACTTPSKFDSLSEGERQQLNLTNSEINLVAACRDAADGNDAAFNAKCSKLLANKQFYAKFREVDTYGATYKLIADASATSYFSCNITPSSQTTELLSKLKPMDAIYITGQMKKFTTTEKNSPFRKNISHQVDMDPCEVKVKN